MFNKLDIYNLDRLLLRMFTIQIFSNMLNLARIAFEKTHKISVYFVFHGIASVENSWYSVKREKLNLDSSMSM